MEICAFPMSYAELTPVTSCSSSTNSEMDSIMNANKKQQNISDFNRMLEELEYGSAEESAEQYVDIEDVPDTYDEEEEVEDEDVQVKYPYERKDVFEHLQERIEQRLNDSGDQELEERAKEINFLLKTKQAQWKAEEKLEREQSRVRTHEEGSIYTCVMCSKAFTTASQLQKHTDSAHDVSGLKHKCKMCGKGYKHKKNLFSHEKLHLKEFKCDTCSLVFQSLETLSNHQMRFHKEDVVEIDDDDLEYGRKKCSNCQLHFSDKIFKRHSYYCLNKDKIAAKRKAMKAQSVPSSPALSTISCASFTSYQPGPSSFRSPLVSPVVSYRDKSCQVCGETFASRQSMLRHVGRKHPEVKDDPTVTAVRYLSVESPNHQYACTDCGKRLTTRAALTAHRARAHSTEQRHQCTICQKSYAVPSELRKHIQRVHATEQHKMDMSALDDLPELDHIF